MLLAKAVLMRLQQSEVVLHPGVPEMILHVNDRGHYSLLSRGCG